MDALTLLRDQAATADGLMTRVFAEVTAEQLIWRLEGSTTNTIAATFLHVYHGEDRLVGRQLGKPTIFDTGGWRERLGYDPAAVWSSAIRPDPDACRAYAAEVRAATKDFLEHLDPAQLQVEVDGSRGPRPLIALLSLLLVIHKATHLGEIDALLGCQGLKGLPF